MKQIFLSLVFFIVATLSASVLMSSSRAEVPGGGCSGTCTEFGCSGGDYLCNIVWCCSDVPCTEGDAITVYCYDSWG
jgi:hypothetical protein